MWIEYMNNMSRIILFTFSLFVISCAAEPNCSQPPKKEDFMDCCKKSGPMRELAMKCAEKFPMTKGVMNFCHGECMFNETGILANGEIQMAKAPAIMDELFKAYPDFIPVAKETFAKCEGIAKSRLPKVMENKPPGSEQCHPLPALISSCFLIESFIACPTSMWQNTDACKNAKEYLKDCPM